MSIGEMQAVLARLYVDGPFLELFCLEPERAFPGYELTGRERSALAAIDRKGLTGFAHSLRNKTFGRFRNPYRLTIASEKQAVPRIFRRFYELRTIRPNEPFYRPTLEFGDFLEETLRALPSDLPYAPELARYERSFFEARFAPREPRDPAFERVAPPPEVTADFRPRLRPGIKVLRFDYDMAAIEKSIEAGEIPPADLARSDSPVVFQSLPPVGAAKKFQISRPFRALIAHCDGRATLAEITPRVELEMGSRNLRESLLAATRKLLQMGLVV